MDTASPLTMAAVYRCLAAGLGLLMAGCAASTPRPDYSANPDFRKAHLACHQQMMAASGVGWGNTPNRHQYFTCMKAKGYDA